ncbi:hypothetical protein VTH82DRAFT_5116 [Thermothelomyces myriococcoides]
MSEALVDEIEAINSIFGDGTLAREQDDPSIFILTLPDGGAASLRLRFPSEYPDVPPEVLGTHSAGSAGKHGAAARHLALFRDAVGEVYEPGQVCLFDAIEKVKELLAAAGEGEGGNEKDKDSEGEEEEEEEEEGKGGRRRARSSSPSPSFDLALELDQPPAWTVSEPIVENKSVFVARCARVHSPTQAADFIAHLLASDKRVRTATHNITAWRITGSHGTRFEDYDDDGETAAGGRLLHLMQLMDLWDTMVVVTRWYGGVKLGPRRFALINQAARDAFVKAGLVKEEGAAGNAGKKKKGGK